jgi:hypothetical protein
MLESGILESSELSAADMVRLIMGTLDDRFSQEVRNGLQEVLAIIENAESDCGKIPKPTTTTMSVEDEHRIAPVSFAGSSRSEPQITLVSQKASLSQRIRAKLRKRTR